MQITIINQQRKIRLNKRAIKSIILKTLKILNPKAGDSARQLLGKLTVLYVNDRTIRELNYRFLGKRQPTDVLCFDVSFEKRFTPLERKRYPRGRCNFLTGFAVDIVISTEEVVRNSRIFKTSPPWEANLCLIHGILHLFGYDDRKKKDRIRMQRKAIQIMKQIQKDETTRFHRLSQD